MMQHTSDGGVLLSNSGDDQMIGGTIKRLRKKAGFRRQEDLARAMSEHLGEGQVDQSQISKWETNSRQVPDDKIEALAAALGVPVGELLTERREAEEREAQGSDRIGRIVTGNQIGAWAIAAGVSDQPEDVRMVLVALASFVDPDTWVVSISQDELARSANLRLEMVRERWHEVLDSDFVERIGTGEWTLKLVLPSNKT